MDQAPYLLVMPKRAFSEIHKYEVLDVLTILCDQITGGGHCIGKLVSDGEFIVFIV